MEQKTKGLPRRKYNRTGEPADFKAEILKMVANGQTVPYVSTALGVSENLIYRWGSPAGNHKPKGRKRSN